MFDIVKKITNIFKKNESPFEIIKFSDNEVMLKVKNNVTIVFDGEVEIDFNKETNIVSMDLNIDSRSDEHGSKIRLNSRWAKQIRDNISSIEYRERLEQLNEKMKKLSADISLDKIATLEEKIKYLEQFVPKKVIH